MPGHARIFPAGCAGLRRAAALALLLALCGCAAQQAYRDGRALLAQDQVEAGLLRLQDAVAREPGNAEYKMAYLGARDGAIARYLERAERAYAAAQPEPAAAQLQAALALDPQNERARAGLRALDAAARQAKLLAEAGAAAANKQYEPARQQLAAILSERPDHPGARALLREIGEKTAPAPAESGLAQAFRQPLTIEFRDAPLKQVFDVVARRSGLNFIFDKDVKIDGRTTILLKNSTVEAAIYFLLISNQLEQQVMDANTILIYPNVALKVKEYQEMVVKTFFLANAEAKQIAYTLKTILKSRDVVVDEKLNLVIVRDSAEAIRLAERLVALQDVAEPEVMLDVEILEVKRSRLMELGVAWPGGVTLAPLTGTGGRALTVADLNHLNQRSIGISELSARINANKTDGDTNILANPRIRVRNKEKAKVLIGERLPVITTTISPGTGGFASESVAYVDVGLTLNAEPTIYLNNEVAIRISLEVSNLVSQLTTKTGSVAYQIGTRQATTLLQLKDGENQVLAGLINNEDRSSGSKVPGFGDIPLLGRLFGSTKDDRQKTEIVLSITPRLVRNIQRPEAQASEFSTGTESNFRRRPDLSPKAPTQLPGMPAASAAAPAAPVPVAPAPAAPTQAVPTPAAPK
ncbi:secretin N-terminal domain-containing protein [Janthinobacterium fluminis]|uniref:Secretin N-terminal domain-containing protein n=1 Tax=Janthinobacterium fluminis TaxID=2987524 RepID=A0ABT5JYX9_9BURK|nr:secretin N-terminal domain-containing protein [Janthinobacterium fluminis]MDC8757635.1 secretin N-terminal domain-containing protein [Janthinobacterium fluminis]